MKIFIYTLSDPDSIDNIRYVGKTGKTLFERLKRHIKESKQKRTHKEKWVFSLLKKNKIPVIQELDNVEESDWEFFEKYWISQMKSWGFSLLNGTEGGEGSDGFRGKKHNKKTRQKISRPGELNKRSKLTEAQVREIIYKNKSGISINKLSKEYSISWTTAQLIIKRKRWKHVIV